MRYICCRSCLEDEGRKKAKESMRSFERLSVSMTGTEIEIWCNRHQITVATIGIESRFDTTVRLARLSQGEIKERSG